MLREFLLLEVLEEVLDGAVGGHDHRYDRERFTKSFPVRVFLWWKSMENGRSILQSVFT